VRLDPKGARRGAQANDEAREGRQEKADQANSSATSPRIKRSSGPMVSALSTP